MQSIIRMENITKKFGDFTANDSISIDLQQGEIQSLLGENGAGKTTLMNVLYGLYAPTEGKIFLDEEQVIIKSPMHAINLGIGMIHQHFMLIKAFSVMENVILGLKSSREPFLDFSHARQEIIKTAKENNLIVDPDALVSDLSVGQQQQVEILKALYRGAKILILDEPTAVLTPKESEKLFVTLRSLAKKGHTIIFISHKLEEVLEISDRITILRKGKKVETIPANNITKEKLAELMVGRECELSIHKNPVKAGDVLLDINQVSVPGNTVASSIKEISLQVKEGQIVGIAGVDGNGQRELMEGIAGLRRVSGGQISMTGKDITNATPLEILEKGVALVPEDRNLVGSVDKFSLVENMILRSYYKEPFSKCGIINYKKAQKTTEKIVEEYDIRTVGTNIPVCQLSGGNLQKLIMAREIHSDSNILLAMHPTRGLDVGAIEFVHHKLLELRAEKKGILLVSTELDEILDLSDQIVVLYNGSIMGIVEGDCAEKDTIGRMMMGEKLKDISKPIGEEQKEEYHE